MKGFSNGQFGLIIAYIIPGFIGLAGLTPLIPIVATWLRPVNQGDFGLGPPIYAILGAMSVGLILSCCRWLLIDRVHLWMGVKRPIWDDANLDRVLGGFDYLVQSHFRYYEFCGNTMLAIVLAYGLNRSLRTLPFLGPQTDIVVIAILLVLFAASRDALSKYYLRTGRLIGLSNGDTSMFNGNDHGGTSAPHPKPDPKSTEQAKEAPVQPQPVPPAPKE